MIYPGTDLKFMVTTKIADFSLQEDDFNIQIKNRWGQLRAIISKESCFQDYEENFYFVLEDLPQGKYYAYFEGLIKDNDYEKQKRRITDKQLICIITDHCCCCCVEDDCDCGCDDEHCVEYTPIQIVSLDDGDYLMDMYGNYILTSEGRRIKFLKEGNYLKDSNGNYILTGDGRKIKFKKED